MVLLFCKDSAARFSEAVPINSYQQMAMLPKLMKEPLSMPHRNSYRKSKEEKGLLHFTVAGILTEQPEILTT